ncbi:hypothetical protein KBA73_03790, partial [Patescibacteria group bacterium]|nr:hypothetical protein [Patescibacteria group bacterium]
MSEEFDLSEAVAAERLITPESQEGDRPFDLALRPKHLEDFIGQSKVKENLRIFLEAAKKREEPCEHILFYG